MNNPLVQVDPGLYVWTILTFLVLLTLLAKFAWGPLLAAMAARQDAIRKSLDEARQAKQELERLNVESARILAQARIEAEAILSATRSDATQFREELKQQARAMRRNPTPAQAALWERLKDKQCGFTFNREVVMGSAIVDFAAKTRWLVVETGGTGDPGGEDAEATLAALSDRKLSEVGVRVLRFAEEQVLGDIEVVVKAIKDELQKPFEKPRTAKGARR